MGFWGWLNYTPAGQLTQIRWKLANVSQQINDPQYQIKAVAAFAKDENFEQASELANQIQDFDDKAYALIAIAQAIAELKQPEIAADLLAKALASANQIQDSDDKAYALIAIAEAEANLKNWGQALKVVAGCQGYKECEVESLARVLTIHAEQQHPELKEEEKEDD